VNPDFQSAAENLVHALLWLAEDAQAVRRIPAYNPIAKESSISYFVF